MPTILFENSKNISLDKEYTGVFPVKVDNTNNKISISKATKTSLGVVTVGNGLNIDENGVISATGGTSIDIVDNLTSTATDKALSANMGKTLNDTKQDKLTAGTNITIEDNVISATGGTTIMPATTASLGGVIIGEDLDVETDGTLSVGKTVVSSSVVLPFKASTNMVSVNNLFCAYNDGMLYTSTYGEVWDAFALPIVSSKTFLCLKTQTLNDGQVMIYALSDDGCFYYSFDITQNWLVEKLPEGVNYTDVAVSDNNRKIAISAGYEKYAVSNSTNVWETKEFNTMLPAEAREVYYFDGYYYILNANIRSADAELWLPIVMPGVQVVYSNILMFKNKYFATGYFVTKPYAIVSSDGVYWDKVELPMPDTSFPYGGNVIACVNDDYIIIAYNGYNRIFFSKDLSSWHSRQIKTSEAWDKLVFNNKFLIANTLNNRSEQFTLERMSDLLAKTMNEHIEIVDNLTSTATDKALSANMGKTLNDTKQDKLTAGANISIEDNVISSKNTPINKFECFLKDDGIYEEVLPLKTVFSENNKIFATLCNDRVIASSDGLNWVESIKKEGITDICIANGVCTIVSPSENLVYSNSTPTDSSLWNSIDGHFTSSDDFIANHIASNEMITIVAGIGRQQYITTKYSYKRYMMTWEDGSFPFTVGGEIIGLSFGNGLFYAVARYYADVEMQNQKLAVLSSVDGTNWNIHDVANLTAGDRSITSCKIYHNNNNETLIQIGNWGYIVAVGTDSQALSVTSYHNYAGNYIGYGFGRWWSNKNEILYNTQDFVSFEKEDFDFITSPATAVFNENSLFVLFENSKQAAKIQGNIQDLIPATTDRLGGVIVGNGLNVNEHGVLSVQVENSLSSYNVGRALSANMGKTLNDTKQDKLTAGTNITIEDNVISVKKNNDLILSNSLINAGNAGIFSVVYYKGYYFANFGTNGTSRSRNGINWEDINSSQSFSSVSSLSIANNELFASLDSGKIGHYNISQNRWDIYTIENNFTNYLSSVVYFNGKYCLASRSNYYYGTNYDSFTAVPFEKIASRDAFLNVCNDKLFISTKADESIAGANDPYYSTDGENIVLSSLPRGDYENFYYVDGKYYTNGSPEYWGHVSDDGINWTGIPSGYYYNGFSVLYRLQNKWIALRSGWNAPIAVSTDFVNWKQTYDGDGIDANDTRFVSNDNIIIVSSPYGNKKNLYSVDGGATFNLLEIDGTTHDCKVVWCRDRFFIRANNNIYVLNSTDDWLKALVHSL